MSDHLSLFGAASGAELPSTLRRRPVPSADNEREAPALKEDGVGFEEDDPPTKFQEYVALLSDYVFWVLVAYLAATVLLWVGERLGLISPHFQEWMPTRWWHSDPHVLQRELFANATMGTAGTAAQFESLKLWIEGGPGGWVSPKLVVNDYLSERGRYERRLEVKEAVEQDEVLVRLPISHVLSADFCQQDATDGMIPLIVAAQKASSEPVEIAPWTWITLYMLRRTDKRFGDAASAADRLFDALLQREYVDAALSYIPNFWHDEDLQWLNGTDFLNGHVMDVHAAIETEYHKLSYLVPKIQDSIQAIDFKKWAMVAMSRGESISLPGREDGSRLEPQFAIMPLIDLVDHHLPVPDRQLFTEDDVQEHQLRGSLTNSSYSSESAAVVLRTKGPLAANAAVTAGYGVRSNGDYLLYHGFTMPYIWSDRTVCVQYSMIELPLPEAAPAWKSRFLAHPYRFTVPACPSRKSTPHVIVGAARFLVATKEDVVDFQERSHRDPSLIDAGSSPRDEKFLRHEALEALTVVCDTVAQPPVCRWPLGVESERRAWRLIMNQTFARVSSHVHTVLEDDDLLRRDDALPTLTVNQRHAVVVRREEKLALQRWCSTAAQMLTFLESPEGAQECGIARIPDEEPMENDEPRARPAYWRRLLEPLHGDSTQKECKI